MFFRGIFLISTVFFSSLTKNVIHENNPPMETSHTEMLMLREDWVDSVYYSMTTDEQIGQLFWVAAYSNPDNNNKTAVTKLITENHIGGVIFFKGSPGRQANLTNYFQSISKIPLMISIDGEWGLSMRLDSTITFPHQLTLGAIDDNNSVFEMGKEIALECKRIGIHMNLAPVIDINVNPNNPVIGDRSFGEDKFNVSLKGLSYMEGMQKNGVLACAKHFPGHGDTDKDSHKTLPLIAHDFSRLNNVELYPFKILINSGVAGVMAAHLYIPALDSTPNLASSLSKKVITGLLKEKLGFDGLVISDALNMSGVANYYSAGEVDYKAFMAGNDVLLYSQNVPLAIEKIKAGLASGEIDSMQLKTSVRKILRAKFATGLNQYKPIEKENLYKELNSTEAKLLRQKLYEEAMTMVVNEKNLIPFSALDTQIFASVSIGSGGVNEFQKMLTNYTAVDNHFISRDATKTEFDAMAKKIASKNTIIISLHDMNKSSGSNYNVTDNALAFIRELEETKNVIVVVFGNPYSLKNFPNSKWILEAYEDNETTQRVSAQVLFGGIKASGRLPVSSGIFKAGDGMLTLAPVRFKYTIPEEIGIDPKDLEAIDAIAYEAISEGATPGCEIFIAKEGKVFYRKSFGYHTYAKEIPVKNSDVYDIASITKIASSTISLMYFNGAGKFDINKTIGDYIGQYKKRKIGQLKISNVLTHQAGLPSWIPFYRATMNDSTYENYYCNDTFGCFKVAVADSLYLNESYPDTIWKLIGGMEIESNPKYVYSDLGFYMFRRIIDSLSGTRIDTFVMNTFYKPMGLQTIGYLPLNRFSLDRIPPTEFDTVFRGQLVQGYVHDQGAAMLGGISGHAGIFSNAHDLAVIMQMLLNKGSYGGKQYLKPEVVESWTKHQSTKSRRGYGFDMAETNPDKINPVSDGASKKTFGHTGFTGTCAWADPENGIVFVFLSNRVYPNAENWKLVNLGIRTRIQQVVYDALAKGNKTEADSLNVTN